MAVVAYEWGPYDSTFKDAFPDAFPDDTSMWGERRDGDSLTQEDIDALERVDYVLVLPRHFNNAIWSVEVSDTGNSDGYVEFGRLHLSPAYEPSHSFSTGAEIGWQTSSRSTETEGGSFIHEQRPRRRVANVTHQDIGEDEALVQVFEAMRRLGTTEQFLFVWADDDTTHLFRRSFLAVLQDLDPLRYPNVGAFADQAWSIVEEI